MKHLPLFAFLLFSFSNAIVAQSFISKNEPGVNINLNGECFYGSNALSHSFLKTLVFGGKITPQMKDQVAARLSPENSFLFDARYGAAVSWSTKNKHRIGVDFSQRYYTEAQFSENFSQTLMYGNTPWGTELIDLGTQQLQLCSYTDVRVTYGLPVIQLRDRLELVLSFSGGIRLGHQFMDGYSAHSSLQTTALTEILHLKADILYRENRANVVNGVGAGLDISAALQGTFDKGAWKVHLFTQDLGFIRWNSNSTSFKHDFDISFEGIEIEPTLDGNANPITRFTDSLQTEIARYSDTKAFSKISPASVYLSADVAFNTSRPQITGFSIFSSVSIFSNPFFRIGIAPFIEHTFNRNNQSDGISFRLPISYSNFYGIGLGAGIGYEAVRIDSQNRYRQHYKCSLHFADLGFRSASVYGAVTLGVTIEKTD